MPSRRREYHVDCRAKKAAIFFVACEPNTATRVKILDAMRIRGYSQSEAVDPALQMQVRCEAEKIKGEAIPGPPADVPLCPNWSGYPGQKINHTTINRWVPLWSMNQTWDGKAALYVATKNRGKIQRFGGGVRHYQC